MRYPPTHAAPSDSAPFKQRRPKALRTVLSATVALVFGLTPAFMLASPAAATDGDLTIAAASAVEGQDVVFTLRYIGPGGTYTLSTAGDTATAGTDYTAAPTPATQVFLNGTSTPITKTVRVSTTDDALYESTETFTFNAASSTELTDTMVTAVGSILDNDTQPSYTLTATSPITESSSSSSSVNATLSAKSGVETVVTLSTADGTATEGVDYDAPPIGATIIIPAGSLSGTAVPIPITDDDTKDVLDTETFTVSASATNVSTPARSTQVSIVDAQTTPKLTLSAASTVAEGDPLIYTVTASDMSELPISVNWNAVAAPVTDDTNPATPGDDFPYPSSRTLTIPAGSTTQTFTITPTLDDLNELPEDFAVQLASPVNATLGTVSKKITEITGVDSAPIVVSLLPGAVIEGASSTSTKTFTVTLDKKSGRTVTADWATSDGTATVGKDYLYGRGKLTFPAGTLTQTITVGIIGDTVDEGTGETFDIDVTPAGAPSSWSLFAPSTTTITITDDDNAPTFTFDSVSMKEGDSGNAVLFPIKLSNASTVPITFNLDDAVHTPAATAEDSALATGDFQLLNSFATILPGMTTGYAVVLLSGDKMFEAEELGYLEAKVDMANTVTPDVTEPFTKTSTFTIQNDDKEPTIEINSVTGHEGDTVLVTGTTTGSAQDQAVFNLTLAGASVNGSKAASANDFSYTDIPFFVIPPGTDSGSVLPVALIVLTDDTSAEPAETILVSGHSIGILDNQGVAPIGTVIDGVVTIAASDNGGPPVTGVTLTANRTVVDGGGGVILSGTATPGASVQPMAKPYGNANLVAYGNAVTAGLTGAFSFSGSLSTGGVIFGARSNGENSPEVTVYLREAPTLTGGSTAKGSVTLTVTGMPKMANQLMAVQRQNANGSWSTIGSGKTGSDGTWTNTFTGLASGTFITFQGLANGNASTGLQLGASAPRRIGIR